MRVGSTISHYTNLEGFKGIVESGFLWASNVSFLNDHRELQHGVEASIFAIQRILQGRINKQWREPLEKAAKALRDGKLPNTYAVCFCQSQDLLSQWRSYGGQAQGVSIQFDTKELGRALGRNRARLYSVIYTNASTRSRVTTALKDSLNDLQDVEDLLGPPPDLAEGRDQDAYEMVCRLLPQFKHLGFREERERRFVVQHPTLEEGVQFRARANVLVPYLELGLGAAHRLPITSVTIGPGRDQKFTERSLRLFLDKSGYGESRLRLSAVPFRN